MTWLESLLAPAEDPRRTAADPMARQGELLTQVRAATALLAAVEERLAGAATTVRERVAGLEEEARRALLVDQEHVVRLALQHSQVALL